MSFDWKHRSQYSFYAASNLRTLEESTLRAFSRGDAGEPSNIREDAQQILLVKRNRNPDVPDGALSPHERDLYRLKGIKTHKSGQFWFVHKEQSQPSRSVIRSLRQRVYEPVISRLPDISCLPISQIQALTRPVIPRPNWPPSGFSTNPPNPKKRAPL